jgi:septal ring factor EnvC (AmiA/AmiB activator)
MFTKLEQSLLGTMEELQKKLAEVVEAYEKQSEELEKAKADDDFWYKAYSRVNSENEELVAKLDALKQEKEEQDAVTSDSSNNLKEAI